LDEIKEQLNSYRILSREISGALRLLEDLDQQAFASGASGEMKVIASLPLSARFEDIIADKADLERVIKDSLDLLHIYKKQVVKLIARNPDPAQRTLLAMRCLECMKWEDIAERMHYSKRHIYNLYNEAVHNIA
jgi:DNA-directed RNA polymerase specialized sigma24 family protein